MRVLPLLLLCLLPGCELVRDIQLQPKVSDANARMARARIDCDMHYPAVPGGFTAHARCINAAEDWVVRPLMPYPDLLTRSQTSRLLMSAQADRGELPPGALAQLTAPEDERLTLGNTTLDGPLPRQANGDYYAPVPQLETPGCSSRYGFADCGQ